MKTVSKLNINTLIQAVSNLSDQHTLQSIQTDKNKTSNLFYQHTLQSIQTDKQNLQSV